MDLKFVNKEDIPKMPQVLYKYRTWNKAEHKRLLTHSEIYYASPNEFNEVTECNLERDYNSVTRDMIWDFCRDEAMREVDEGLLSIPFVLNRANELFDSHRFYDMEHRKDTEKEFRIDMNKTLSIFSASETPINERLWNSFAAHRSGYCIGIDFIEIYGNDEVFGTCGRVCYYDENDPPKISPISLSADERVLNMMRVIYSLPKKFEYEEEFRFSKMHMQNRKVPLNNGWIKEVILGSEMLPNEEAEIVALVKDKYPMAELKKLFVEPTFGTLSIIDY